MNASNPRLVLALALSGVVVLALAFGRGMAGPGSRTSGSAFRTWTAAQEAGLDWLESDQDPSGSWTGAARVRDTAIVIHSLAQLRPESPALPGGRNWLANQGMGNTDERARLISALGPSGLVPRAVISQVMASRVPVDDDANRPNHPEGGWGIAEGYATDVLDTALVLAALPSAGLVGGFDALDETVSADDSRSYSYGLPPGASDLDLRFDPLVGEIELRIAAGGPPDPGDPAWLLSGPGHLVGLPQDVGTYFIRIDGVAPTTRFGLRLSFLLDGVDTVAIPEALDYLRAAQNADGGWGLQRGAPSEVALSATVADALVPYALEYDLGDALDEAEAYLVDQQGEAGTWGGESVDATARAYAALDRLGAAPDNPYAAEVFLFYSQKANGSWSDDPYLTALVLGLGLADPGLGAQPGDCNADGKVDAGDNSALVLEFFDGDGSHRGAVISGGFAGNPLGCDANADIAVDAADLACTVLLIFAGPGSCGG